MGLLERMATKAMVKTVRKSLPVASTEKLTKHYNQLLEAQRLTDDVRSQGELQGLKADILAELERRTTQAHGKHLDTIIDLVGRADRESKAATLVRLGHAVNTLLEQFEGVSDAPLSFAEFSRQHSGPTRLKKLQKSF